MFVIGFQSWVSGIGGGKVALVKGGLLFRSLLLKKNLLLRK